jgi:hypothetical protein
MIYDKEPILVLWDAVKSLKDDIPIYKESIMDEDEDSIPESYLLLRSDITNTPYTFGDGQTQIRRADCDIILVTKGVATNTTDLHNINRVKVTQALEAAGLKYEGYNLGYDDNIKSTQYTWSVTIYYGKTTN